MSNKVQAAAWEVPCKSHTEKLVLVALADNANDQFICWPSLKTIARKCQLSVQGVLNQIESLTGRKLLKVQRVSGKVNKYLLELPDQSTPLTRQRRLQVNAVEGDPSTPLKGPVNPVDPNRKEPSFEPPTRGNHKPKQLSGYELPLLLNCEPFLGAWRDWEQHRREKGKKLTPLSATRQLSYLESLGLDRAVAAIQYSIKQGWTGIYEHEESGRSGRANPRNFGQATDPKRQGAEIAAAIKRRAATGAAPGADQVAA